VFGNSSARRPVRHRGLFRAGPLERGSDRLEALSRLVLLFVVLLAVPVGIVVGTRTGASLAARAESEAASLHQVGATLLEDPPTSYQPPGQTARTTAVWTDLGGAERTGWVPAPVGSRAGVSVGIWIDDAGDLATPPQSATMVRQEAVVSGIVAAVGTAIAGVGFHLVVLGALARHRVRCWEADWAAVEPLWAGRSG